MAPAALGSQKFIVTPTQLPEVLLIAPRVFKDARGAFLETFNRRELAQLGIGAEFVQDNQSTSGPNVLRGLHYQIQQAQGKLVRVVQGRVFDVAVDLRRSSTNFGRWVGKELSGESHEMLWVPPGFAHGFLVLSEFATFLYKTTDYYAPQHERTLLWNDPALGIQWPLTHAPMLSGADAAGKLLKDAEVYP